MGKYWALALLGASLVPVVQAQNPSPSNPANIVVVDPPGVGTGNNPVRFVVQPGQPPPIITLRVATSPAVPGSGFYTIRDALPRWLRLGAALDVNAGIFPFTVDPNAATSPSEFVMLRFYYLVNSNPSFSASPAIGVLNFRMEVVALANGLTTSTGELRFSATTGASPPPQLLDVRTVGGNRISFTATPFTNDGGNWLSVSGSTVTPASLSVNVSARTLPANGRPYEGSILLTPNEGGGSPLRMPVTFFVGALPVTTPTPQISVGSSGFTFPYQLNQSPPPPRAIMVSSPPGSNISFTAQATTSSGGPWLQIQQNGTTPGVILASVVPSVANGLAPGPYVGQITVNGGDGSVTVLPVRLNVSTTSQLTLSTGGPVLLNVFASAPVSPAQTIIVNSSDPRQPVPVSVLVDRPAWLSATLDQALTPATLTVTANAGGLPVGNHTGTIFISSRDSALNLPVSVTVSNETRLNVSRGEIHFSGPAAPVQTLAVTSNGSTSANYSVQAVPLGGVNWLQAGPSVGVTPGSVQAAAAANQPGGNYFGYLAFTSTGAPPFYVPASWTAPAAAAPALSVNPAALTFTAPGAEQTLAINHPSPVPFSVTQNGDLLDITPASGQTNGFVRVRLSAAAQALGAGSYRATITVRAAGLTIDVPVTINVPTPPPLTAAPASLRFTATEGATRIAPQPVTVSSATPGQMLAFSVTTENGRSWLAASPATAASPVTVEVRVDPTGMMPGVYQGAVQTAGLRIPVTLEIERRGAPRITQVVHGASFQAGALSPGLITTLYGAGLGPQTGTGLALAQGRVSRALAGVRVLFDGVEAPLLFVREDQINCVAPYALAGRARVSVQVEYAGQTSTPFGVRVEETSPGVFDLGGGQAAAVNQDGVVNGASRPAARGSVVTLFLTGEGALTPPGVDGEVTATAKQPLAPVGVRIGDVPAEVLFAGAAPGLVQGVLQVNVRIPAGAPAGPNVPLVVTAGAARSAGGVTLAVQ